MPILPVIGNHDAGGYLRPHSEVAFYFDYFPTKDGKGFPVSRSLSPELPAPYAYRKISFANTTLIGIDSDFQASFEGRQLEWATQQLTQSLSHISQ